MKLDELLRMSDEERAACKKSDILEALSYSNSYDYRSLHDDNKRLNESLTAEKAKIISAKELLVGYLGLDVDRDEWSNEIDTKKLHLNELIGMAISKRNEA